MLASKDVATRFDVGILNICQEIKNAFVSWQCQSLVVVCEVFSLNSIPLWNEKWVCLTN